MHIGLAVRLVERLQAARAEKVAVADDTVAVFRAREILVFEQQVFVFTKNDGARSAHDGFLLGLMSSV